MRDRRRDRRLSAVQARDHVTAPDGRRLEMAALTVRDWEQLRQAALSAYRKEYVQSYKDTLEFRPQGEREAFLREKMEDAARFTHADLPKRKGDVLKRENDRQVYDERGAPVVETVEMDYWQWWSALTPDGRVYTVWLSMRRAGCDVTLDEADRIFSEDLTGASLEAAADKVGELTMPKADPTTPPGTTVPAASQ